MQTHAETTCMEILSTFKTVKYTQRDAQTLVDCPYSYVAIHVKWKGNKEAIEGLKRKSLRTRTYQHDNRNVIWNDEHYRIRKSDSLD